VLAAGEMNFVPPGSQKGTARRQARRRRV